MRYSFSFSVFKFENSTFAGEEIIKIDSYFNMNRSSLPSLFIVTPFDKTGVSWTGKEPSAVILDRLSKLASAALILLDTGLFTAENHDHVQVNTRV